MWSWCILESDLFVLSPKCCADHLWGVSVALWVISSLVYLCKFLKCDIMETWCFLYVCIHVCVCVYGWMCRCMWHNVWRSEDSFEWRSSGDQRFCLKWILSFGLELRHWPCWLDHEHPENESVCHFSCLTTTGYKHTACLNFYICCLNLNSGLLLASQAQHVSDWLTFFAAVFICC